MMPSRGMGAMNPKKIRAIKTIKKRDGNEPVKMFKQGGESKVNEAGNYTKPALRKRLFNEIKAGTKGGDPGEWSARKAQLLAKRYKEAGGGYKD